ncbi:hypothetical protein IAT40_001394 [Kwoniella sp. CBS 6097]
MPPKPAPSLLLTRIHTSKRCSIALIPDTLGVSRTRSHTRHQSTSSPNTSSDASKQQSPSSSSSHSHVAENRPSRSVFSRGKLAAFAAEGDLLTSPSRGVPPIRPSSLSAGSGPSSGASGSATGVGPHQSSYGYGHGHNQIESHQQPRSTRSTLPKPVLKTNPYAANYAVSEADLAEPFDTPSSAAYEPDREVPGFIPRVSLQQEALTRLAQDVASGARQHRRRPVVRRAFGLSKARRDGSEAETITPSSSSIEASGPARHPSSNGSADLPIDGTQPNILHFGTKGNDTVTVHDGYITYTGPHISEAVISFARLRDACTCKLCRDPSTKQRTITTGQAVQEATAARPDITLSNHQSSSSPFLTVSWKPTPDTQHIQDVPVWKLRALADPLLGDGMYQLPHFRRKLWDHASITKSPNLRIPFSEVKTQKPQVMFKLLQQLQVYGLVVIDGVPTDLTGDEDCRLREVMGYIGEIRNTFYGETWNVKSVKQSKNVAYTDLDLGLHMDLLYFSSPPRFQALHCLRNRVNGGMSYFVDSFKVAHDLPGHVFSTLSKHKIPYIYNNDNHFLRFRHPVLNVQSVVNPHSAVNWSPPFRDFGQSILFNPGAKAPVTSAGRPRLYPGSHGGDLSNVDIAQKEQEVYTAIADFERCLADERYKHSFTMKEGDLVLFDNRRVLHARTAFHDKTDAEREQEGIQVVEGEPTRWLKGCYLDGEVVWDKLAVLKRQLDSEAKAAAKKLDNEARMVEDEAKGKVTRLSEKYAEPVPSEEQGATSEGQDTVPVSRV